MKEWRVSSPLKLRKTSYLYFVSSPNIRALFLFPGYNLIMIIGTRKRILGVEHYDLALVDFQGNQNANATGIRVCP